jgi:hypothetical protein
VSDIDTAVVDSLKVLDLEWPIREADIGSLPSDVRFWGKADIAPVSTYHLRLSSSRKAIASSSTRTASSMGITGRASNTKAGSIEQNL